MLNDHGPLSTLDPDEKDIAFGGPAIELCGARSFGILLVERGGVIAGVRR